MLASFSRSLSRHNTVVDLHRCKTFANTLLILAEELQTFTGIKSTQLCKGSLLECFFMAEKLKASLTTPSTMSSIRLSGVKQPLDSESGAVETCSVD